MLVSRFCGFFNKNRKAPKQATERRKTQGAKENKTQATQRREAREAEPQKGREPRQPPEREESQEGPKGPTPAWKEEEIQTQDDIYQV